MKLTKQIITDFQHTVLSKGKELYREMPWREDTNPYYVLLSEIMLQQTQVPRVLLKFEEFISKFPTIHDLASAEFDEVLMLWTGLGYNRRARFLHQAAQKIVELHNGILPNNYNDLVALPGIGPNTAASILVYSYNEPLVFVETNVRTVFIYTFFPDIKEKVDEKVLIDIANKTMFRENPRQWYWALMDYGVLIKKTEGNFNRFSKLYSTQSKFEGSNRQKRSQILRFILEKSSVNIQEIIHFTEFDFELCMQLIDSLVKDNLVVKIGENYSISK